MDIPLIAQSINPTYSIDLYRAVYRYTSMYLSDEEIVSLTGYDIQSIKNCKVALKKATTDLPPDEMTQEALYGYLAMSDTMVQQMMEVYMTMKEDFDIYRNNVQRTDGKKTLYVQPKDLIALMQTLMKTQLERAAVLTKFAAVSDKKSLTNPSIAPLTPKALTASNSDDIEVEIMDIEFEEV